MNDDWLFRLDLGWIGLGLLLALGAAAELGYRAGRARAPRTSEHERGQVNAITGAVLGLLALLIGFTFSMAVARFDARQQLVVEEANAIGTTALRARMLPGDAAVRVGGLLGDYTSVRLAFYRAGTDDAALAAAVARTEALQEQLWRQAIEQMRRDERSGAVSLFVQALNEAIDAHGKRLAAMRNHVPASVLLLLGVVTMAALGLVGFGLGLLEKRQWPAVTLLALLLVAATLVIMDLDRPRRGLITISQQSMVDLQRSLQAMR